jgi:vacuolar iron transporter family protein
MLFRRICRSVVRRDQVSLNGFPSPPFDSELFDEAADGSLMSCDAKTPGRKRDPSSRRTLRGRATREGIEQRQSGLSWSAWCFCASPGSRCHRHRPLATLGADTRPDTVATQPGYGCWRQLVSASSVGMVSTASHPAEPHAGSVSSRLNWLRAGVLGANDGIVSTAGIVVGVAAATVARGPILTAGIAGLAAGAVSMALGEYVSVSTQRDTERALLRKERGELREDPAAELDELAALYEAKGLSTATARTVAEELTDHDAFAAHAEVELGIDPDDLTNPWQAALSSALSFTVGALLPLIAILLPPTTVRIPVTVAAVLVALVVTGAISASLGGAPKQRAITRNIIGGSLALGITYAIGHLVGAAIA